MRNLNLVIMVTIVVALGFMFTGCGSSSNIMSDMSGTWKSQKSHETIKINLSGEKKTVEIGSTKIPITVSKVDAGSNLVMVKAKTENGQAATWSFQQMWNDNGSSFTIQFDHDGIEERLSPA